jgi:hypothetical protein
LQDEELERLLKQAVDAKERERLEAERKALEEKRRIQEEERRRQAEERRRIEEQQRVDAEKREQLKRQGLCPMNFEWLKVCFVFVMRLSCADMPLAATWWRLDLCRREPHNELMHVERSVKLALAEHAFASRACTITMWCWLRRRRYRQRHAMPGDTALLHMVMTMVLEKPYAGEGVGERAAQGGGMGGAVRLRAV